LSVVIELSVEVAPLVDADVSVEAPASVELALLVDEDVSAAASAAMSALASILCARASFEPPRQCAAINAGAVERSERFMACSPVLMASRKSVRRTYAGYSGR
jgi:hypothetical protein